MSNALACSCRTKETWFCADPDILKLIQYFLLNIKWGGRVIVIETDSSELYLCHCCALKVPMKDFIHCM